MLAVQTALALPSTVYGLGEAMCGDAHETPRPCAHGAVTASGETLRPWDVPSAAVPMPARHRMRPVWLRLKLRGVEGATCVAIRVNDKANEKWQGERGLDLSPAAVRALGAQPHRAWSNEQGLEVC